MSKDCECKHDYEHDSCEKKYDKDCMNPCPMMPCMEGMMSMHHMMPCMGNMMPMHQMPMMPWMGGMMPMEQMPMMQGMYDMMPMEQMGMPHGYCMPGELMPMYQMPMCGDDYYADELAGLEDYYEDDHHEDCEDYENFVDALNEAYPDLNDEAKCLLKKLMEIDFTLIELNLYLDTHPTDRRALAQFNRFVCMRKPILERLDKVYGPIALNQPIQYPWAWLNQPWPWRIHF